MMSCDELARRALTRHLGVLFISAVLLSSSGLAKAQTEGITQEKIISVGISNIESGSAAFFRDMGMGAKYYMMYRNSIGGVAGYKFDVDVLDNQLTPAGGAQTVRQFLAAQKFLVIIVGTPSATGAFGILEQEGRNVPVLTTGATALIEKLRGEGKLSNVYGEFPNFDKGSLFDMKFLIGDLGKKTVAIAYEDTAVGQGAGKLAPPFAKSLGATAVEAIPMAPTSTNLSPIAARLKAAGIEAVDVVARAGLLVALQKAAAAIDYHPVWMSYAPNFSTSYLSIAGDVMEGTYFQSFLEPLSDEASPTVKTFKEQMQKFDSKAYNEVSQAGWVLGEVTAAAIEKATQEGKQPLTRAAFMEALNGFRGQRVGMALGVGYTANDHSTMANVLSVYQVRGGHFTQVSQPRPIPSP
jgi:branched-chain amino acid transport system substrate-binding protein